MAAYILLKDSHLLGKMDNSKVKKILQPYFVRKLTYYYANNVRKEWQCLVNGEEESRIELLPAVVDRLQSTGNYCHFRTISAEGMRHLVVKKARHEHKIRHKNDTNPREFQPGNVDTFSVVQECGTSIAGRSLRSLLLNSRTF